MVGGRFCRGWLDAKYMTSGRHSWERPEVKGDVAYVFRLLLALHIC